MMTDYPGTVIAQLPLMIAYFAGLITALHRRQTQPHAALLAASAFAILLLDDLAATAITYWLIHTQRGDGSGVRNLSQIFFWLQVLRMVLHTIAIGMIIRALFPALPDYVQPTWRRR